MRQLMEGRSVISGCFVEALFRGQMNAIGGSIVKAAIRLIMPDIRPGTRQYAFTGIYRVKRCSLFGSKGGNAFDLLSVEDRVNFVNESALRFFGRVGGGLAELVPFIWRVLYFPELDPGPFFSFFDVPIVFPRLFVGHPPRIVVAPLKSGRH
jgi:hypothetical protein